VPSRASHAVTPATESPHPRRVATPSQLTLRLRLLSCPASRWLRPANRQLCGALPPNLPFTVCQISGSACIPMTTSNFSTDCGEPRPGPTYLAAERRRLQPESASELSAPFSDLSCPSTPAKFGTANVQQQAW
jgi:hypothetical protein